MKNMNVLFGLILVLSLCQCKENKTITKQNSITDKDVVYKQGNKQSIFISLLKDSLNKKKIDLKKIQVKNLNSFYEMTTDLDSLACDKWKMNINKIRKIIELSKIISNAEKHYLYDVKLCSFEGILKYEQEEFLFTINGGGWMDIVNKNNNDDSVLLGCNIEDCTNYFISRGNMIDE